VFEVEEDGKVGGGYRGEERVVVCALMVGGGDSLVLTFTLPSRIPVSGLPL